MRFAIITALYAAGALAGFSRRNGDCDEVCMTFDQAQKVAENFRGSIAAYSKEATEKQFAVDFEDYSDSVSELINNGCTKGPATLGAPTFTSRADFEKGQGAQPPIPFEIEKLWYSCEGPVVLRWKSAQTPEVVTGNIVIETTRTGASAEEPFLIKTVYSEFNSGAWMVNLGIFKPDNCTFGAGAPHKRSLPAIL